MTHKTLKTTSRWVTGAVFSTALLFGVSGVTAQKAEAAEIGNTGIHAEAAIAAAIVGISAALILSNDKDDDHRHAKTYQASYYPKSNRSYHGNYPYTSKNDRRDSHKYDHRNDYKRDAKKNDHRDRGHDRDKDWNKDWSKTKDHDRKDRHADVRGHDHDTGRNGNRDNDRGHSRGNDRDDRNDRNGHRH